MSHVFISYAPEHHPYAHSVVTSLQNKGFDIWFDDRIDRGDWGRLQIASAIAQCSAFIIILSDKNQQSKLLESELNMAKASQKPIFALLLDTEQVPPTIEAHNRFTITKNQLPPAHFYDALQAVVTTIHPSRGTITLPIDTPPKGRRPSVAKKGVTWGTIIIVSLFVIVRFVLTLDIPTAKPKPTQIPTSQTRPTQIPTAINPASIYSTITPQKQQSLNLLAQAPNEFNTTGSLSLTVSGATQFQLDDLAYKSLATITCNDGTMWRLSFVYRNTYYVLFDWYEAPTAGRYVLPNPTSGETAIHPSIINHALISQQTQQELTITDNPRGNLTLSDEDGNHYSGNFNITFSHAIGDVQAMGVFNNILPEAIIKEENCLPTTS